MSSSPPDRSTLHVLVIDDNPVSQELTRSTLTLLGVSHIDLAEDGHKALEMVEKQDGKGEPYDLLICDWMMPVMDGITFLETFRQTNKRAVFIMVTARTSEEDFNEAKEKGADYFFMKPLDLTMLKIRLDAAIDASFARRANEGMTF